MPERSGPSRHMNAAAPGPFGTEWEPDDIMADGQVSGVAEEGDPCRKSCKNTPTAFLSPPGSDRRRASWISFARRERNTAFGTGTSGPQWLEAINRLYDQIRGWLREDDPEGLLDIVPYQVSRTEPILGTYDAPALQILLGPAKVRVEPVGRFIRFSIFRGASGTPTEFAGRVDIGDGLREYNLFRERRPEGNLWQFPDKNDRFTCLNRQEFERILQELLS